MSILIRGMEMPKSCERCPCRTTDAFGGLGCQATGYIPLRKTDEDRPNWCPLVPVPPHGRLIDADALIDKVIAKYLNFERNGKLVFAAAEIKQDIIDLISDAPTIIPASEEVYDKYTDTAGTLHWTGTHSGKHTIRAEEGEKIQSEFLQNWHEEGET